MGTRKTIMQIKDGRKQGWFWIADDVVDKFAEQAGVYGFAVYCVLAKYADKHAQCWPSRATIAKKLGISSRSVATALRRLEELGMISTEHRIGPEGDHTSNLYKLLDLPTLD